MARAVRGAICSHSCPTTALPFRHHDATRCGHNQPRSDTAEVGRGVSSQDRNGVSAILRLRPSSGSGGVVPGHTLPSSIWQPMDCPSGDETVLHDVIASLRVLLRLSASQLPLAFLFEAI